MHKGGASTRTNQNPAFIYGMLLSILAFLTETIQVWNDGFNNNMHTHVDPMNNLHAISQCGHSTPAIGHC